MPDAVEISRRLKAARMLAGATDEKGRPIPLAARDLAALPALVENKISANTIEEIEQLKRDARPMELREIARALDLPDDYFDAERLFNRVDYDDLVRRLVSLVEEHGPQTAHGAPAPSAATTQQLGFRHTGDSRRRARQ